MQSENCDYAASSCKHLHSDDDDKSLDCGKQWLYSHINHSSKVGQTETCTYSDTVTSLSDASGEGTEHSCI